MRVPLAGPRNHWLGSLECFKTSHSRLLGCRWLLGKAINQWRTDVIRSGFATNFRQPFHWPAPPHHSVLGEPEQRGKPSSMGGIGQRHKDHSTPPDPGAAGTTPLMIPQHERNCAE